MNNIYKMTWYNTFDSAFWITVISILTGSIGLSIKYCLKSKCDNVNCCWGGLKIHRNVEIEQEEEMKAMELGLGNSTRNLNAESIPNLK